MMAESEFAVIQFDKDGGDGLAVIHTKWLTPRKTEVFWPPFKDVSLFNKALKQGQEVDENKWKIYSIKRKFFETDDLDKAKKKLRIAEETSDLNSSISEIETAVEHETSKKRTKKKPYRFIDDSEEEGDNTPLSRFQRPEKVNFLQARITDLTDKKLSQPSTSQQSNSPCQQLLLSNTCLTNEKSQENVYHSMPEVDKQLTLNSNCKCQGNKAEYRSLLSEICTIKEQNAEILNYLKSNISSTSRVSTSILPELPVKLPNTNFQELETLDNFLQNENHYVALRAYLSSLGGRNVAARTNKILKHLLDDSLACKINFVGSRNQDTKKAFCNFTGLKKLVVDSVRLGDSDITEKCAEDAIKVWLKHASERLKRKSGIALTRH